MSDPTPADTPRPGPTPDDGTYFQYAMPPEDPTAPGYVSDEVYWARILDLARIHDLDPEEQLDELECLYEYVYDGNDGVGLDPSIRRMSGVRWPQDPPVPDAPAEPTEPRRTDWYSVVGGLLLVTLLVLWGVGLARGWWISRQIAWTILALGGMAVVGWGPLLALDKLDRWRRRRRQ